MRRVGAVAEVLVVLGLVVLAGTLYDAYFDGGAHRPPLLLAAVAGALAGALTLGRRRVAVRAAVAVLSAVPVLLVLLHPGGIAEGLTTLPGPDAVRGLGADVLRGWARMTTSGTPARPDAELLAMPLALAWTAAFAGAALLRDERGRLLPALPPFAALLVGLLLTAAGTATRWPVAGAVVALVVLLAVLRTGPSAMPIGPDGRPARPVEAGTGDEDGATPLPGADPASSGPGAASRLAGALVAAVVVALVTAGAVAGAWSVPAQVTRAPYDPRTAVPPPTEIVDATSPLVGLKRQLRPPVTPLFTVRVVESELKKKLPPAVRVAALDDFDGTTWQARGEYLRPGARIPGTERLARPLDVTLDVEITGLTGPLLPVVGRTTRLDLAGDDSTVRIDSGGTNAVATRALGSGARYRVSGVWPGSPQGVAPDQALAAAVPDTSGDGARATTLPGAPPQFAELARRLTGGQPSPYAQLIAIRDWLKQLPYGLDLPPGESYAVLDDVLFPDDPDAQPTSFAEQRASAFAVLARAAGFPARVAVGYRMPEELPATGVVTVTSANAFAWAEVKLTGYGWVAFDATDVTRTAPPEREERDTVTQQLPSGTAINQSVIDPGLDKDDVKKTDGGGPGGWIAGGVGVLLLVPLGLLVAWLAKLLRRRRRRSRGGPREQVLGAWAECGDRLREAGFPPTAAQTPLDAAYEQDVVTGPDVAGPLERIAPLVAAASYAPWGPPASDADEAWDCHAALRRALDARTALPLRPLRRLDPRPLWPRPSRRTPISPNPWPPGLRTPAPDAERLAAVLVADTTAPDDGKGDDDVRASDGRILVDGDVISERPAAADWERALLGASAPARPGAPGAPQGGADVVVVEQPGAVVGGPEGGRR